MYLRINVLLFCFALSSCNLIEPFFDKTKFEQGFYDCPSCNDSSSLQNDLKAFYSFEGVLGDDSSNSSLNMTWWSTPYTTQPGPHSSFALDCANSSNTNSFYSGSSAVLSMGNTTDFSSPFGLTLRLYQVLLH